MTSSRHVACGMWHDSQKGYSLQCRPQLRLQLRLLLLLLLQFHFQFQLRLRLRLRPSSHKCYVYITMQSADACSPAPAPFRLGRWRWWEGLCVQGLRCVCLTFNLASSSRSISSCISFFILARPLSLSLPLTSSLPLSFSLARSLWVFVFSFLCVSTAC